LKTRLDALAQLARSNMLRTRLVLGLMSLLLILLLVGLYSIHTCNVLVGTIYEAYEDNYASIQAMQEIKLACAKLNGAVVMKLAKENAEALGMYRKGLEIIRVNLAIQKAKPPQGKEQEETEKLLTAFGDYERESRVFFRLPAATQSVPRHLIMDLSPLTEQMVTAADRISDLNTLAIQDNKEAAKRSAWRTIQVMFLAMVLAVVVALYASYRLGRGILEPIDVITASIQKIGAGDLKHRIPVFHRDELGNLAQTVNRMAGQLHQYQESQTGKLLRLHKTLERTLASYPDPIFVIGRDNRMEFMNPAGEWFLAAMDHGSAGRFPAEIENRIERALQKGEDYLAEKLALALRFNMDGGDVYYLLKVLALWSEEGGVFGAAMVLEDVSRLRLVDDMKSNLISTVSHELKTPLTGLRISLHLLEERTVGALNMRQAELVTTAKDDSERLLHTLDNLLDLARLEASPLQLPLEPADLGPLVRQSVNQVAAQLRQRNQKVNVLEEETPRVDVNAQRIGHLFTNFLTNASKHSPDGAEITVRVRRRPEGGVRVSVIDRGPGISAEHAERIFERFYRVPGQKKYGMGLGLSIAKEIAEAHGARIGVASQPGQGSEFYADFPESRAESRQAGSAA
jgi:signal transduction histidine kinase/HAMP domain-containing protein